MSSINKKNKAKNSYVFRNKSLVEKKLKIKRLYFFNSCMRRLLKEELISISNNRYIIWKKEIILTEKESKAFKERISQKTDIPISAINIYKLNYNPITVIRIDLELLNLIEKSDTKDSNYS